MSRAVIAFHGDFANANVLRRDMGDPSWVTHFWDDHDVKEILRFCRSQSSVVLIGYSRGGSLIGHLSKSLFNIERAVLYESPLLGTNKVGGNFPVLWIWNEYWQSARRRFERADTLRAWELGNRKVIPLNPKNAWRHTRFTPFSNPPIGHNWNQSVNPIVEKWIRGDFG